MYEVINKELKIEACRIADLTLYIFLVGKTRRKIKCSYQKL